MQRSIAAGFAVLLALSLLVGILLLRNQPRGDDIGPERQRIESTDDEPAVAISGDGKARRPTDDPGPPPPEPPPVDPRSGIAPDAGPGCTEESGSAPRRPGRPLSVLEAAYLHQDRDPDAAGVERRLRDLFASEQLPDWVLREVSCTRAVCRMEVRWSAEISPAYNRAMVKVTEAFSREISMQPDGPPSDRQTVIILHVPRPGHTIESIRAEMPDYDAERYRP